MNEASMNGTSPSDRFLDRLADFCLRARAFELDAGSRSAARKVVLDSVGVALGALDHRAARSARRFAARFAVERGARLWGSGERVNAEHAALLNGAPLRAYDYNDYYFGRLGGAHPSDILTGVLAVAEAEGAPGRDAVRALCMGYEVVVGLSDYIDPERAGWDYPVLTTLGAVAAAGALLGLDRERFRHAFSIAVNAHYPSNEVESSEPDAHGELTMWKRFNGSDGVRQAVQACYLASAGVEGVVRPFEGRHGFLSKLRVTDDEAQAARRHLDGIGRFDAIARGSFKRWPVGSRGQSAIQSALRARAALLAAGKEVAAIRKVSVRTDPGVYDHLYAIRAEPLRPRTREAADHSLPYIVAAALAQGRVGPDSFEAPVRESPTVRGLLEAGMDIVPAPSASPSNLLAEVELEDDDGRRYAGGWHPAPGSAGVDMPFEALVEKFRENVGDRLQGGADALIASVASLDASADVRALVTATLMR